MNPRSFIRSARHAILLAFLAAAIGCRHDARLTYYEGGETVSGRFAYEEGFVIETEAERRFYIRFHDVGDQGIVTDDQTLLLYLSLPIHRRRGIDWSDPSVFLVWSSFATEFAGFLQADRLKTAPVLGSPEAVSGEFVGTVRPLPTGPPQDVNIQIQRVPVQELPPEAADAPAGLVETIEETLHDVDNAQPDREDRRPETGGGIAPAEPEGAADSREHDRP